jgi:L-serine/L-threonine ammonia-lyase
MGSYAPPAARKPWIETPLVESTALSLSANCRIFLKLELLQPSGSFKSRGIGNLILEHTQHASSSSYSSTSTSSPDKPLHFYSSSGGNAGLACVTAARSLGHKASVVVPNSTKPSMIAKIEAAGATSVTQHGDSWYFADKYLRDHILRAVQEKGEEEGVYVPPFDDPRIWQGASSMIEEIQQQLPDGGSPDAIILSVGGGGLFAGVMVGLDSVGWSHVPVLAMETRGADSLNQALQAGELVTLPAVTSLARSLGAIRVAPRAFEYAQRPNVKSVVLDDAEAVMGVCRLADDERMLVEPACGVCVALCYEDRLRQMVAGLGPESRVVVVVCGGSDVTVEMVAGWRQEFGKAFSGMREGIEKSKGKGGRNVVVPSDVTTLPRT